MMKAVQPWDMGQVEVLLKELRSSVELLERYLQELDEKADQEKDVTGTVRSENRRYIWLLGGVYANLNAAEDGVSSALEAEEMHPQTVTAPAQRLAGLLHIRPDLTAAACNWLERTMRNE